LFNVFFYVLNIRRY